MKIEKYLKERKEIIDQYLANFLKKNLEEDGILEEAIKYGVLDGGKRLRPILTLATFELFQREFERILPTAIGIELIHSYSLIHDDLPCMDNDITRRGKPSVHAKFGEAVALLAGDALLTLAFKSISENSKKPGIKGEKIFKIINEVADAAGIFGMIKGQILDLQSENEKLDRRRLKKIHSYKTGALICFSVRAGAILGEAKEKEVEALSKYGKNIGLAYQIVDDILDFKKEKKKATFPGVLGIEKSLQISRSATNLALRSLETLKKETHILKGLALYLQTRKE